MLKSEWKLAGENNTCCSWHKRNNKSVCATFNSLQKGKGLTVKDEKIEDES